MAPPPNYRALAQQDAAKYGLGPWFVRQIGQESGFNPNARSSAGAEGIAQFMPSTASSVGLSNPLDPVASLDAAARFDARLVKQYGSVPRALSAYNSGNPDAYLNPKFANGQTYNYVRDILGGGQGSLAAAAAGPESQPLPAPAGAQPPTQPLPARQPVDFRPQLLSELAKAANGGGQLPNLAGFYSTLRQALHQPAPTAPPATEPLATAAAGAAAPPPASFSTKGGKIVGNTSGEQSAFLQRLTALSAYEHAPIDINSGYRSQAEQAALYANRANNPNPVAPPGRSLHQQGLAADGTVNGIPLGTLPAAILAKFGLETVPGDPVHVQFKR